MNQLELIAMAAGAGAALASTDAASISRIAIEVARQKLGVPALAVYDQQAFIREMETETEDAASDQPTSGQQTGTPGTEQTNG